MKQVSVEGPVNIGYRECIIVAHLVDVVTRVARKGVVVRYVSGRVGLQSTNFSNARVYSLGRRHRFSPEKGIRRPDPRMTEQVRRHRIENRPAPTHVAAS